MQSKGTADAIRTLVLETGSVRCNLKSGRRVPRAGILQDSRAPVVPGPLASGSRRSLAFASPCSSPEKLFQFYRLYIAALSSPPIKTGHVLPGPWPNPQLIRLAFPPFVGFTAQSTCTDASIHLPHLEATEFHRLCICTRAAWLPAPDSSCGGNSRLPTKQ